MPQARGESAILPVQRQNVHVSRRNVRRKTRETINVSAELQGRSDHIRTAYLRKSLYIYIYIYIYIYKFMNSLAKSVFNNIEIAWFDRVLLITLLRFYNMKYRINTLRILKTLFRSMLKFKIAFYAAISHYFDDNKMTKSKNKIVRNPPIA